jgi:hypothetical protein
MSTPAQSSENICLKRRQGIRQPSPLVSVDRERTVDRATGHDIQSMKTGMAGKESLLPL